MLAGARSLLRDKFYSSHVGSITLFLYFVCMFSEIVNIKSKIVQNFPFFGTFLHCTIHTPLILECFWAFCGDFNGILHSIFSWLVGIIIWLHISKMWTNYSYYVLLGWDNPLQNRQCSRGQYQSNKHEHYSCLGVQKIILNYQECD